MISRNMGERTANYGLLPYLLIIGLLILCVRFAIGFYYTSSRKAPFKETTAVTLFLVALVAFVIFILFMHCIEFGICKL